MSESDKPATNDAAPNTAPAPTLSEPPRAPRRRSVVGVSMGAGLLVGFLVGISFPRLFALTMFFGAALGAAIGALIDRRRAAGRG